KYCPECKMRYADSARRCVLHKLELLPVVDGRLGTTIAGRYTIEAVLGEGGMATVYRARLKVGGRIVAVKVMNKALLHDQRIRERFRREIKLAATLVHPNVVTTEDHGELDDGCPFLVMELLEGDKLEEIIQRGPIPIPRALSLMLQITHTVARAHDLGILHRDLKPENVHVCVADGGGDHVKVIDFGIARSIGESRITESGELFGTPQYLSPERIAGEDHTPADDLYALGVMFFEMLTGRLPFTATDSTSYFLKQLHELPPAPKTIVRAIPDRLNRLVLQLLEKKASSRPGDARRVTQELLAMIHEADQEPPPSVTQPFRREDLLLRPTKPAIENAWTKRLSELRTALVSRHGGSGNGYDRLPDTLRQQLVEAEALVDELTASRENAFGLEAELEAISEESHTSRLRIGAAVDTLGTDLSALREAARDSFATREELARQHEDARALVRASEHEVAAFGPPHRAERATLTMANSYRLLALAIE
ncbi:MAG: serine/threonine protein kinase, partial [Proteobacteria bacterium]